MKVAKDSLLGCFAISLLVAFVSAWYYVAAYVSLGSPLDRDGDGCVSRVLVEENDRYISVCPDDSIPAKIAIFLAPKAAVASIVLLTLFFYQSSKDALSKKIQDNYS